MELFSIRIRRTFQLVSTYEIELYWDFAPYSFGFAEVAADGSRGVVGGLLYHGKPDESFAVVMEPFHGWSIHT